MIEIDIWIIIGAFATIIGLILTLIAMWHNNKTMKKGLENLSELVELNRQKNIQETQRFELERIEQETRKNFRKQQIGLKLIDLVLRMMKDEEIIEEYEEEVKK